MEQDQINHLIKRWERLKTDRQPWETTWQELCEYIAPRKVQLFSKSPSSGGRERHKVLSGRPQQLAKVLASTFGSLLTNPSSQWFQLRIRGFDEQTDFASRQWLESVERTVYHAFLNSNFHNEVSEVYQDLVVLGTGALYVDEDKENVVRFSARSIAECFIDEDHLGRIDTNFRCFKMTLRNVIEQFGIDAIPDKLAKKAETKPDDKVEVLHCVYKRPSVDPIKKTAKHKPYASVWLLLEGKHVLKESGFDEFPWAIARFDKITPEVYGRSPGSIALPAIKHVNEVEKLTIKARQLEISPPLVAASDSLLSEIDLTPAGVTYVNNKEDKPEPLMLGAHSRAGDIQIEYKSKEIADAFYFDVILTQDSGTPRTATEIMQRTDERSKVLVTALERLKNELLAPLIERVIGICARAGMFSDPPVPVQQALQRHKGKIDIVYTSPLARAQTVHEANAIMRTFEAVIPLGQMGVDVLSAFDMDLCVRTIADAYGVPAAVMFSKDQVAKMRKAQEAARAQEAQTQALERTTASLERAARAEQATQNTNGPVKQALNALSTQMNSAPQGQAA